MSASEGKRVFKFLWQMEFGEGSRFEAGCDEETLRASIENDGKYLAQFQTAGPEPRVTVILQESREAGTLKG